MRILVVSDTHGRLKKFDTVLQKEGPVDALFHLGDVQGTEEYFEEVCDGPVHMVAGNNDDFSELPLEKEVTLAGKKIFMAHGHNQEVYAGMGRIVNEGLKRGVDIVMFGHTHVPYLEEEEGMLVLNPGSLSYPRQENHKASYIMLEIDENGQFQAEIKFL